MEHRDEVRTQITAASRAKSKAEKEQKAEEAKQRITGALEEKEHRLQIMRDKAHERQGRLEQAAYETHLKELEEKEAQRRRADGKNKRAREKLAQVRKAEEDHKEEIKQHAFELEQRMQERREEAQWRQQLAKEEREIRAHQKKKMMDQRERAMNFRVAQMEAHIVDQDTRLEQLAHSKRKMQNDRQRLKAVTKSHRDQLVDRLHGIKVSNRFEQLDLIAQSTIGTLPPVVSPLGKPHLHRSRSEASGAMRGSKHFETFPMAGLQMSAEQLDNMLYRETTRAKTPKHELGGIPLSVLGPPSRAASPAHSTSEYGF